jgi:hypothetical protein
MKQKSMYHYFFKLISLLGLAIISGVSSANIINADFSDGLNGWSGDIIFYDVVNDIDNNSVFDVDFSSFNENFSVTTNGVTLNTSTDGDNEYWGIYLFQQFEVASNASILSLMFNSIADFTNVTLVDENLDVIHDFATQGLSVDISSLAGTLVSLEFAIEDFDAVYDDFLTISNISISTQSTAVSEPSVWAFLFLTVAYISIRKKKLTQ